MDRLDPVSSIGARLLFHRITAASLPTNRMISGTSNGILSLTPFAPVDGYRVYLTNDSGQESQFDVGAETRLSIPMPPRGIPVGIQVASYHHQYGTGHRSRTVAISPGAPPELHFSRFYNDYIMCDPYSGLPAAIPWEVRGGVAPFFIAVGNREAYETSEREGIGNRAL